MSAKRTPAIAIWLIKHFGCSPDTEAVIGDLIERYEEGHSRFWFWWQATAALGRGFLEDAFAHKTLMIRSIIMGWGGFVLFKLMLLDLATEIIHLKTLPPSAFEPVMRAGRVVGFSLPTPWRMLYPVTFLICTFVCIVITGAIAARVGREHRKAAVLAYASSLAIAILIDAGPMMFIALWDSAAPMPWRTLGIMALHLIAILLGGLVTRSATRLPALSR
jgi:hypothetical protein